MDTNLMLFILLLSVIYTVCTVWICYVRCKARRSRAASERRRERRERRASLRAGLLDGEGTVEHRIDAATRDASDGFEWCTYCEFANFKRLRYCALCGERLQRTFDILYSDVRPSDRLRRSRRRKEWGRRIDLEGRAFWYHAKVPSKSALTQGYVLRFETPAGLPEREPESEASTRKPLVGQVLLAEAQAATVHILPAASTDSSVFPDGTATDLKARHRDILQLAEKEFPTKFSHFVVCSASLLVPAEVEALQISLHRDYLVEESIHHLSCLDTKHLRSVMRINFLEESGIDAGGVHREWFMLLSDMLVNASVGLFKCTNEADQVYYFNPNSAIENGPDHLAYYYAAGRLVGRALLEGDVLGFHFATPLLRIMVGQPVSFDDLESVDPVAFKSMLWLLENDNVESLGLDFTVATTAADGSVQSIEFVPGGREMNVTDANKREYLDRRLRYALFESVSDQLYAFLKGLYEVVPQHLLMLFDPEEFDFVLCGVQDIDVADWERHTKTSSNLDKSRLLRWFWEIVRDMPNEYRQRLLQFATGRSRVPLAGFKGLTSYDGRLCPFTLKGVQSSKSQYIRSHACFNRLDLPLHLTRNELKTGLYGILDTDFQGFTIA